VTLNWPLENDGDYGVINFRVAVVAVRYIKFPNLILPYLGQR